MAIPSAANSRVAWPWFWTGIIYGVFVIPWLGPGILPIIAVVSFAEGAVGWGVFWIMMTLLASALYVVWLVWYVHALARSFKYNLTKDTLTISRGVIWRKTSRIPLRRVQDVVSKNGPFLRAAGLGSVHVQTAGLSTGGNGGNMAVEGLMVGLENADAVADEILALVKKLKGDV